MKKEGGLSMPCMKKGACALVVGLLFMGPIWSQSIHSIPLHHGVGPAHQLPADPALVVQSLEAPDAFSTQAGLNEIKRQLYKKDPPSNDSQGNHDPASGPVVGTGSGEQTQKTLAESPQVVFGKKTFRVFGTVGVVTDLLGGTPNDNTLAVNNSGHVLIAVNSYLWGWDQNSDTLLFPQSYIPLSVLGQLTGSDYAFDPKLAYDPEADRFVLVFLINNTPANNRIAVCFSKTNDPRDGWNVYTLPGNPLNNNRWSDFPAIAVTKDKVVLSLNLIVPNVSWQLGFDGSILWEMDKAAGYSGTATLPTLLHHDFKFNGKYTRNLLPLTGWNGVAEQPVLMSNRNFSPSNDSVFVWTPAANPSPTNGFECHLVRANPAYGLPPNGRQSTTPANDPTKGLQTNDGRWLGGLVAPDGAYHVVSTTRTFSAPAERAGIYYGILPLGSDTLRGRILSDPIKDFGYPNIVFTGNEVCDEEYLIGFNHTSPSHYPGNSVVYVGNDGSFSSVVQLKAGLGPVSKLGGAERWGDYFGLQRVYGTTGGEPNLREQKVWAAGFFGSGNGGNSTWLSAVTTPDSNQLEAVWELFGSGCDWSVSGVAQGGTAPYRWITSKHSDTLEGPSATWSGLCSGDSMQVWVLDARGCMSTVEFKFPFSQAPTPSAFPNPTSHSQGNRVVLAVSLPVSGLVALDCIDATGRVVHIGERQARAGRNELSFDPQYLKPGWYQIRMRSGILETFAPLLVVP